MANTLLSFYKDSLKAEGYSAKYLNRAFLQAYFKAYKDRSKNLENGIIYDIGTPEYEYNPVFSTDFYNKNGGAYCRFIELHHGLKAAFKYLDGGLITESEALELGKKYANALKDINDYNHINGF